MIVACPYCGKLNGEHVEVYHRPVKPSPGDVGLCASCCRAFVFGRDGDARRPTLPELSRITADPRIAIAKAIVRSGREGTA